MPAPDPQDLARLGLAPGAMLGDVHQAWERIREMWASPTLATYGLLDDEERAEVLSRLTAAYERVLAAFGMTETPGSLEIQRKLESDTDLEPEPDRDSDPGAYLRFHRMSKDLTLETIARETRIRPVLLGALEVGDFENLPERVFVRGFVIAFSQALGIPEPGEMARVYLEWLDSRRA